RPSRRGPCRDRNAAPSPCLWGTSSPSSLPCRRGRVGRRGEVPCGTRPTRYGRQGRGSGSAPARSRAARPSAARECRPVRGASSYWPATRRGRTRTRTGERRGGTSSARRSWQSSSFLGGNDELLLHPSLGVGGAHLLVGGVHRSTNQRL